MTPEQITELARQAGFKPDCPTVRLAFYGFDIKQFATLVRNATLEEAAVKCDAWGNASGVTYLGSATKIAAQRLREMKE